MPLTAEDEQRFDGMMLHLIQKCSGGESGIELLLEALFGFLRRKTDFFSQPKFAQDAIMKSFVKQQSLAEKANKEAEKRKEEEEIKRKKQEQEEQEKLLQNQKSTTIVEEITDEEEKKINDEIQKKKADLDAKMSDVSSNSSSSSSTSSSSSSSNNNNNNNNNSANKDKKEGEDEDDSSSSGLQKPNKGNGGQTSRYSWTQTLSEVEMKIPVPVGTKARDVSVTVKRDSVRAAFKNPPRAGSNLNQVLVEGNLYAPIKPDDCMWTLEDNEIVIPMHKTNDMEWWKSVIKGDEEIDTKKVSPENSKLSDLDGETRSTVEKMMLDQQRRQMGLPTYEQMEQQEKLKKFMSMHPEMDFSQMKNQMN